MGLSFRERQPVKKNSWNAGEEEDVDMQNYGQGDAATQQFDRTVEALTDLLVDPAFEQVQGTFCHQHSHEFEDTEENRLVYMTLFKQYQAAVESLILQRLKEAVPGFSMDAFLEELHHRHDELMEEVADLLLSLTDFQEFKSLMLDYKEDQGKNKDLHVSVRPLVPHNA